MDDCNTVLIMNEQMRSEQFTDCRIDHYQTPSEVHVSVFAKKVDQERSKVKIDSHEVPSTG